MYVLLGALHALMVNVLNVLQVICWQMVHAIPHVQLAFINIVQIMYVCLVLLDVHFVQVVHVVTATQHIT